MGAIQQDWRMQRGKKIAWMCDCGCGTVFHRYRNKIRFDNVFVDCRHSSAYKTGKYLRDQCGPYIGLFTEYLEGTAARMYRNLTSVRSSIAPFLRYLHEEGISSIQDVSPATIAAFQRWAPEHGCTAASKDISALSTFFKWAIVTGFYEGDSPVIPAVHGRRKKPRSVYPYLLQEVKEIRQMLATRGNERLRAFFELAVESGMRKNELCRLRIQDLSLDLRTCKVTTPNKTMRERTAFFFDRASASLRKWLTVRNPRGGHDFVFHNELGGPLLHHRINDEFYRCLCKTYKGRIMNEDGRDSFSIHRLRHTLASELAANGAEANTIMTVGGWASPASLDGYVKVEQRAVMQGFAAATKRADLIVEVASETKVMSAEDFLATIGAGA